MKNNSLRYLKVKLTEDEVRPIKEEVKRIENDFSKATPFNSNLIGNIENEYKLFDCEKYTEQLLTPHIKTFLKSDNINPKLTNIWANFQKKYEYNPLHDHTGNVSFALWLQIPFTNAEEFAVAPGAYSRYCSAGNFQFVSPGKNGKYPLFTPIAPYIEFAETL